MTVLQEVLSSVTGNIAKAILCIRKYGSTTEDSQAVADADSIRKSIMNLDDTATLLGSSYQNVLKKNGLGENFVAMEVQFNPNTLYISVHGTGPVRNFGGDNLGNPASSQLLQMTSPTYYTLQCQLIFDSMNLADAFMTSDISSTVGSLASNLSSVLNKTGVLSLAEYSVKTPMDGLMSLLTNKVTRQVIFIWGKMFFRGELMGVDNTYTMFNKSGNPIRGVSNLTITQVDATGSELAYWEEAYAKGFTASSAGSDVLGALGI